MNNKQENKLSMYNAVKRVLTLFESRWGAMAGFSRAVTSFYGRIDAIERTGANQEKKITGIATDKQDLKESLVEIALRVAGAVHAYAFETENDELGESVDYQRTDLTHMRDELLDQRCSNIHAAATEHISSLADFGITPTVLDSLRDAINAFHEKSPQPRTAISTRSTYTESLVENFDRTDLILTEQLDRLMLQFKRSDSTSAPSPAPAGSPTGATPSPAPAPSTDFYELYFQAREIIDLGKRTFHQLEFELKPDEAIKISNVVSEKPAKNTGHTTLTWRDMDNDEPRIIEPGQVVFIFTPGGNVEIKNTDNASPGKIMVTVYKRNAFERE